MKCNRRSTPHPHEIQSEFSRQISQRGCGGVGAKPARRFTRPPNGEGLSAISAGERRRRRRSGGYQTRPCPASVNVRGQRSSRESLGWAGAGGLCIPGDDLRDGETIGTRDIARAWKPSIWQVQAEVISHLWGLKRVSGKKGCLLNAPPRRVQEG